MGFSDWKPGKVSRDYRKNYEKIFKKKVCKKDHTCDCAPESEKCVCGEDCKCTKE